MDRGGDSNASFLPLTEAATRLGVSRIKLREAIAKGVVPARRDNEGNWRVDLTGVHALPRHDHTITASPDVLMDVLFDEIETLSSELQTAGAVNQRLIGLAGAQNAALERATTALDTVSAQRDRFADVAGRALEAAGLAEAQVAALKTTTDRAFGLLDRTTQALERAKSEVAAKEAQITAQTGQIDRLFTLSEQAVARVGRVQRPGWISRILGLSGPAKR